MLGMGWKGQRVGEPGGQAGGVWEISDGVLFCVPATRQGCVEKIAAWLRKNVLVVAAAALGIAFVEVRGTLGHLGTRGSGRVLSRGLVCGGEPWLSLGSLSCLPDSSSPPSLSVLLDPGYCLSMLSCEEHPKWL